MRFPLLPLLAAAAAPETTIPPFIEDGEDKVHFCDLRCRWENRRPADATTDKEDDKLDYRVKGTECNEDGEASWWAHYCKCEGPGVHAQIVEMHPKENPEMPQSIAWCGENPTTELVCGWHKDWRFAMTYASLQEALDAGSEPLHCGRCSECSNPNDLKVLFVTRQDMTRRCVGCSAKYAFLGQSRDSLDQCLREEGVTFTPQCQRVWMDNIDCDASECRRKCWTRIFQRWIPQEQTLDNKCLRCDEERCGPAFIYEAAANRRSTGLPSDIERPGQQVCKAGFFHRHANLTDDATLELLTSLEGPETASLDRTVHREARRDATRAAHEAAAPVASKPLALGALALAVAAAALLVARRRASPRAAPLLLEMGERAA